MFVLFENGFVVDSYQDPLLALEKFKPHSYNLVILDIKRLDKKVKVCFLTAGEMYYGASSLPANCFIRKPIENQELMNSINEIIADDTQVT
jgi:DNA-binding response OmpR family regulator